MKNTYQIRCIWRHKTDWMNLSYFDPLLSIWCIWNSSQSQINLKQCKLLFLGHTVGVKEWLTYFSMESYSCQPMRSQQSHTHNSIHKNNYSIQLVGSTRTFVRVLKKQWELGLIILFKMRERSPKIWKMLFVGTFPANQKLKIHEQRIGSHRKPATMNWSP